MNDIKHEALEENKNDSPKVEIQKVFERSLKLEKTQKNFAASKVFGKSFVHKMKMDEFVIGAPQRLPGIESANFGIQLLNGDDISLNFSDVLGYYPSEEIVNPIKEMEKQLYTTKKGKY